jgi:isopentenyl-diphosphate delta-isomerase
MEQVVLVNENDLEIGTMEKFEAHQKGLLHRAFSVLIFNSKGELLIQQRAKNKYHSAGLWTNTCCSHPRPGESPALAAHRRLKEEMGIQSRLTLSHKFIYKIDFDNGLIENELDYVYTGICDNLPIANPDEVADWKYISMINLATEMDRQPDAFTHWFKIIVTDWQQKLLS